MSLFGGSGNSYDKSYNRRMASIYEQQQGIANDMYYYYMYGVPANGRTLLQAPESGYYVDANGERIKQSVAGEYIGKDGQIIPKSELAAAGYTWQDSGVTSQMELEQAQRSASNALIPYQQRNEQAGLELETNQANALNSLLPDQTDTERSGLNLTRLTNEASAGLIPDQTNATRTGLNLTTAQNTAALGLLPRQTELAGAKLDNSILETGLQTPVIQQFYQKTLEGIDPKKYMDAASADVLQANDVANESMRRTAMNSGIQPGSARWNEMMKNNRSNTVGSIVDARTKARNYADETSYSRLTNALGRA